MTCIRVSLCIENCSRFVSYNNMEKHERNWLVLFINSTIFHNFPNIALYNTRFLAYKVKENYFTNLKILKNSNITTIYS